MLKEAKYKIEKSGVVLFSINDVEVPDSLFYSLAFETPEVKSFTVEVGITIENLVPLVMKLTRKQVLEHLYCTEEEGAMVSLTPGNSRKFSEFFNWE